MGKGLLQEGNASGCLSDQRENQMPVKKMPQLENPTIVLTVLERVLNK